MLLPSRFGAEIREFNISLRAGFVNDLADIINASRTNTE